MLFNSWQFLIFFPITVLLYYVVPARLKNVCLLAANLLFYASAGPEGMLVLILCSVWTYAAGRMITGIPQKSGRSKTALGISLAGLFLLLIVFKYTGFLLENVSELFRLLSVQVNTPSFSPALPIGISFFIFQMAGYLIDIYRGDLAAENNFFRFFLFVSFFPQLLAGPIPRGKDLLPQFDQPHKWDYESAVDGFALMIWGFVLKLVIADRAALLVDVVYTYYPCYTWPVLVLATLIFTVQIYCDFYGYTLIARGAARVLGFELAENFHNPYLAVSVQDFWRRWHISLSSWFRDYLYFPLGGSRKGTVRKYVNILIVFLVSGLWHGAQWTFVFWGLLNGLYQVLEQVFHLKRSSVIGRIRTIILISISWIFFRAGTLDAAFSILTQMFCLRKPDPLEGFHVIHLMDGIPGMTMPEFILLILAALLLLIVDISRERGHSVYERICKGPWIWRPVILASGILLIVITGIWGTAYEASGFIYFKF